MRLHDLSRLSGDAAFLRGSIGRKYGFGYLLILLMLLVIFAVSFAGSALLAGRYDEALNDLLRLNNLFAQVEDTNRYLYDCVIYLRPVSLEKCAESRAVAQDTVNSVFALLEESYSRDVMDLCCTVQTYLDQNSHLTEVLRAYRGGESFENNIAVQNLYAESQNTITYINMSFKDIYSAKLVSTKELQAQMQSLRRRFGMVQVILVLASLGVFFLFYRQVVNGVARSVKKLTAFAGRMTQEPMAKEHVTLETGDELEVFANGFNNLVDTIQTQFERIREDQRVREQLQKAEMENMRISSALQNSQLRLLQSRINPHFLFNTLNMISQTAYMEGAGETARLMEATADFLRYNLGKVTKAVTLGDEIANVNDYIYIQQCRFGKRIRFVFETQPECGGQSVPCMVLQPLVENSIKYGVGLMISGGEVIVRIFRREDRCWMEVEDNGEGMTPEVLESLRASLTDKADAGEHIGLRNVYQRLLLYFNGDVKFDIASGHGCTRVRIGLPWRE